jgi:flagellar biosynthetic protein FliR
VSLSLGGGWLLAFLLVTVRALAWLLVVPPFSDRKVIPPTATMAIAAGIAVLIAPTIPASTLPTDTAGLIGAIVLQVLTGLAMGLVISMLISAVTAAGSLLDLTGGLNLPAAIDPLSLDQTPMIGQFYQQLALLLLAISGGYLVMVQAFAHSFTGPGYTLSVSGRVGEVLVIDLTTLFTSAIEIAAPIMVVLFATQIVLALLTKAAPQVNVWVLGMPLQIFLVLGLVAVGVSVLPVDIARLLSRALGDGAALFGGH